MSTSSLPKIIKDTCLDFKWNTEKVWKLNIPVESMLISELSWQFDLPFWRYNRIKYAITPKQVINEQKKYKDQYDRIMSSDLKYPVDIMKNKKDKWEMLDGLHRVVKAKILGHETIEVRKVPLSKKKEILR